MKQKHLKLLIVDDEYEFLEQISEILSIRGYKKNICINNPYKVKDILSIANIDCILSDIEMPGLSGKDILFWLRSNKKYDNIKFMFITGKNYYKHQWTKKSEGYFSKPLDYKELYNTLENFYSDIDTKKEKRFYKRFNNASLLGCDMNINNNIKIHDLSCSGVCIKTEKKHAINDNIILKNKFVETNKIINIKSRIVWKKEVLDGYKYGIEFQKDILKIGDYAK